jgi:hydroxypyruvate isomerase
MANQPDSNRPDKVEERNHYGIKFSANLSMLFTEVNLIDRFQAAKACGFEAVEIQFPYALSASTIAQKLTQLKQKLVMFNVAADDLLQGGEGLACVPEKKRAFNVALAQAVNYAEILKPYAVNVLPGRCLNKNRGADYFATLQENLHQAADAFASLGVKTVVEAINTYDMPGFLIHSGEQLLTMLTEVNHPNLMMQVDVYHFARMGEDAAAFIRQHAKKIGHIQIADCPGRAQPGTGVIDFDELFKAIAQSSYSGWCGAEYKPSKLTQDSFTWLMKLGG